MNLMQKNDAEKPESKTKRKQLSPAAEELFKGFIEDQILADSGIGILINNSIF